jgi:hypothetical protein
MATELVMLSSCPGGLDVPSRSLAQKWAISVCAAVRVVES